MRKITKFWRTRGMPTLALATLVAVGCDNGDGDDAGMIDSGQMDMGVADTGPNADLGTPDLGDQPDMGMLDLGDNPNGTLLAASLSGNQEVPRAQNNASGTGSVLISQDLSTLTVTVDFDGLNDTTAAHIHLGEPGENGPVLFAIAQGAFTSPIEIDLTEADLMTAPDQGIDNFTDAVGALISGRAYFNLHTDAQPTGALRGQIGPSSFSSRLSGWAEVPSVTTAATGTGQIEINADNSQIDVTLDFNNLADTVAAHIHAGHPGENGPVIFVLSDAAFQSGLQVTLTEADLMPAAGQGIDNMADAINAIISGKTYFNLHTTANPPGELRGQSGIVQLRADLSGIQQSPPLDSAGDGDAWMILDANQEQIDVVLNYADVADTIAAHIHLGKPGENGPIQLNLSTDAFASPLEVSLTEADILMGAPIADFADVVGALISGETYINLHSTSNPGGELRGQVGPQNLKAALSGQQEVPRFDTAAEGTGDVWINEDQSEVRVDMDFNGLNNTSAAHIHMAQAGENGPILFTLASAPFNSPFTVNLRESDFTPPMMGGVEDMGDAVSALIAGYTYFNLHTMQNPPGELRGQVGKVRINAVLNGLQEVPAVVTNASGTATMVISPQQDSISLSMLFADLDETIAAHIHLGDPGENGPILFSVSDNPFTSPVNVVLREEDLQARPAEGVTNMREAISAILAGRTYFNLHTTANPGGELRGQVGPVNLTSRLSGAQEVPSVDSAAVADGLVTVTADQRAIKVNLQHTGLVDITAAHIHLAPPGENGPVLFGLADGTFMSPFDITLTEADFMAVGMTGIEDFADAISTIINGGTYFNIHTVGVPSGETRGQIGPMRVNAFLSGRQEVPSVATAEAGDGVVAISHDQNRIIVDASFTGLADSTAAHIHLGGPGENGPILFTLAGAPYMSPLQAMLTEADLSAQPGVADMRDAIAALISGRAYFNLHTMTNPGGELRGQIGAVRMRSVLSPLQEVQVPASIATGGGEVRLSADQQRLVVDLDYAGLQAGNNTAAAHIHVAGVGVNGPVIFGLANQNFASPLNVTLTSADLMPDMASGINDFNDAVSAVIAGGTYFNVHTDFNAGGELRGQIGTVRLTSSLNGNNEVPAVMTAATGQGILHISADQSVVSLELSYSNLTEVTAAHIHAAPAGANGAVMFGLADMSFASPLNLQITSDDFMATPGIVDFAGGINAMITSGTYFNVHTLTNPAGEIRGQIVAQ